MAENLVSGQILLRLGPNVISLKKIFVGVTSTGYYTLLQACLQFQEKPMNQTWENDKNLDSSLILENLVTDKQTDGQANESDFKGCCQTNVERPKQKLKRK